MKKLAGILLTILFFSCNEKFNKISELKSGDVVSFVQSDDYCIAKILSIDTLSEHNFISIYFYKQKFENRPDSTDYLNLKSNSNSKVWGNINWDIEGFEGMRPQVFYFDYVKEEEVNNDTTMNNMIDKVLELSEKL